MLFQQADACFRLFPVAVFALAFIHAVLNIDVFKAQVLPSSAAGESDETAAVNLFIGKGNQRFIPAAVMPEQCARRECNACLVQNRIAHSIQIQGIIRIFIGTVEDGKLAAAPHFNPVVYKYV